jgi:hypothetical protein
MYYFMNIILMNEKNVRCYGNLESNACNGNNLTYFLNDIVSSY